MFLLTGKKVTNELEKKNQNIRHRVLPRQPFANVVPTDLQRRLFFFFFVKLTSSLVCACVFAHLGIHKKDAFLTPREENTASSLLFNS